MFPLFLGLNYVFHCSHILVTIMNTPNQNILIPSSSKEVKVAQSCPTLCNPMDYTVHGSLQARILEGVAFLSPGDLPNPGFEPGSPALEADSLLSEPQGKLKILTPIPSPGDLLCPGMEPGFPTLQADSLPAEPPGKPHPAQRQSHNHVIREPGLQAEGGAGVSPQGLSTLLYSCLEPLSSAARPTHGGSQASCPPSSLPGACLGPSQFPQQDRTKTK